MRINPISMTPNNIQKINFKAKEFTEKDNEDEYVYVPLIWEDDKDTVELSKNKNNNNNNNNGYNNTVHYGRFKKIVTGTEKTIGPAAIIPNKVSQAPRAVEDSVVSTKDSINNTADAIKDMKDHIQSTFSKNPDNNNNDNHTDNTPEHTPGHIDELLGGNTPVTDHDHFVLHPQNDNNNRKDNDDWLLRHPEIYMDDSDNTDNTFDFDF